MSGTVSTDLYVHAPLEAVVRTVACVPDGDVVFTPEGGWHRAAWSASIDTWRHAIVWRSRRAGGSGTIDLLPTGSGRTLVMVSLTTRGRSHRRPDPSDAAALARSLRAAAERGAPAVTVLRGVDGAAAGRRVDGPVPAAV